MKYMLVLFAVVALMRTEATIMQSACDMLINVPLNSIEKFVTFDDMNVTLISGSNNNVTLQYWVIECIMPTFYEDEDFADNNNCIFLKELDLSLQPLINESKSIKYHAMAGCTFLDEDCILMKVWCADIEMIQVIPIKAWAILISAFSYVFGLVFFLLLCSDLGFDGWILEF